MKPLLLPQDIPEGLHIFLSLTEACHPDVGGDVNSDPVVPLEGMEEVIPHKHHLHPALPFFRLIPTKCAMLLWIAAYNEEYRKVTHFATASHKMKINFTVNQVVLMLCPHKKCTG